MLRKNSNLLLSTVLVFTFAVVNGGKFARAGLVEEVATGLGAVGFDIVGQRMPLSGGIDLLVTRNFIGNPQDFGPWDIALQGPLSLSLNTGGRAVRELEVQLNTAVNEQVAPTPLNYVLTYDAGGQEAEISGNLLINADMKINNFGWYELNLAYSSRQTVVRDGRFASDELDFDFDAGPVVVSGNIYADILAVVTQPLFDAAGQSNIFAEFSGSAKLNDVFSNSLADIEQSLLAGLTDVDSAASAAQFLSVGPHQVVPTNAATGTVVPEPAMLLLMLAGLVALTVRRRTAV